MQAWLQHNIEKLFILAQQTQVWHKHAEEQSMRKLPTER